MEFRIIETYRRHNFLDFSKQIVANIFLFLFAMIVIPTVLIINLFKKKRIRKLKKIMLKQINGLTT